MILTPAQSKIAKSRKRFRVINAGRRFGKTNLAGEEIKGVALTSPLGSKIAYIAPTIQQARDIMWESLKRELLPIAKKVNESRLELEIMNKDGDSVFIYLKGWENIETLRGQKFVFVVIDEVAMMRKFWIGWHEVIRPALTDMKGDALFLSTPKGFNHFYDLYNMQNNADKGQDYESFHFTTYDNPYIPVDEIESAKKELTEDRFAQEYMADFRKQEGLVYKEFDRRWHTFTDDDIKNVSFTIAGIDFGFTNPTAVITIKQDYDNNYWVTDEYYKSGMTEDNIAEYVRNCNFNYVYPDPENPSAIQKLTSYGVNVRTVLKNKDSISSGINTIRELFKSGKLKIHTRCVNLISEIETYHYPDNAKGDNENPEKVDDHTLDALRYAISNNSPIQREGYQEIVERQRMRERNTDNYAR